MNILEILEGIKNTGKVFDILRGTQILAREIRQTYNKISKDKLQDPKKKLHIKIWAEYMLSNPNIQQNHQLIQMLDEIIKRSQ